MSNRSPDRPSLRRQAAQVTFLGSFVDVLPTPGLPEIAFAGRSNVGKSSALNALLSQRVARVSRTPGRTQTINLFQLGEAGVFSDLPGYGYAKVPAEVLRAWGPMIEGYLGTRETLRLVVVLIDGSLPAQPVDTILLDGLDEADIPVLVVATKIDRLPKHKRKPALHALREGHDLPEGQPVGFSSVSGDGLDALWEAIEAAAKGRR